MSVPHLFSLRPLPADLCSPQARQEMLTAEAHQSGSQACQSPSTARSSLLDSPFHEAVIKSWRLSGFDFVLSTGTEVRPSLSPLTTHHPSGPR
jgi:hypothetical protein